jgi:hypothetical protein
MSEIRPCRREDPNLWFSHARGDRARAKQLCLGCPMREACLEQALEFERITKEPQLGIIAGLTPQERTNLLLLAS